MVMMRGASSGDWATYIEKLIALGKLRGGSSLANGERLSKRGVEDECTVSGYIHIEVADMDEARSLLKGNPLYEAGGVVEILEEVPD